MLNFTCFSPIGWYNLPIMPGITDQPKQTPSKSPHSPGLYTRVPGQTELSHHATTSTTDLSWHDFCVIVSHPGFEREVEAADTREI